MTTAEEIDKLLDAVEEQYHKACCELNDVRSSMRLAVDHIDRMFRLMCQARNTIAQERAGSTTRTNP